MGSANDDIPESTGKLLWVGCGCLVGIILVVVILVFIVLELVESYGTWHS